MKTGPKARPTAIEFPFSRWDAFLAASSSIAICQRTSSAAPNEIVFPVKKGGNDFCLCSDTFFLFFRKSQGEFGEMKYLRG
jgi:hypothetical protein